MEPLLKPQIGRFAVLHQSYFFDRMEVRFNAAR
jgi:hypothetical protein